MVVAMPTTPFDPPVRRARASLALLASLASLALLASTACSRSKDAGLSASSSAAAATPESAASSCDRVTSMSVCSAYTAAQVATSAKVLAAQCAKLGGVYVAATCPNTSVLGACTVGTGELRVYYASGALAYDAARAEKECTTTMRGTWRAFPW
jgi:hypothetical protein